MSDAEVELTIKHGRAIAAVKKGQVLFLTDRAPAVVVREGENVSIPVNRDPYNDPANLRKALDAAQDEVEKLLAHNHELERALLKYALVVDPAPTR